MLFENFQAQLQKFLKQYDVKLPESTVSMVLGAVVVLVVGLLAYNYFRTNQSVADVTPAEVSTQAETPGTGELTGPTAAVALPTTHLVASGENLWTIAQKYYASGYNWVDIATVNQLRWPNYLQVGQKLTIPKVEVRKPLAMEAKLYPVVTDSRIEGNSYTVVKGDNLWSIAVRAYGDGYKWTNIAQANKLTDANWIHPGNVLLLPR